MRHSGLCGSHGCPYRTINHASAALQNFCSVTVLQCQVFHPSRCQQMILANYGECCVSTAEMSVEYSECGTCSASISTVSGYCCDSTNNMSVVSGE